MGRKPQKRNKKQRLEKYKDLPGKGGQDKNKPKRNSQSFPAAPLRQLKTRKQRPWLLRSKT